MKITPAALASDHFRYAGLRIENDAFVVSGGRVLGSLGRGETIERARSEAYSRLETVLFDGAQIRKDIGR